VCRDESASDAGFTWVDERFLLEAGVAPSTEIPLWFPGAPGVAAVNCGRAIAAGLAFRPLADTVRDTLAWDAAPPPGAARRAGLEGEREAELLRAWHTRSSSPALRAHQPLGA
jgi:2'-hydroxyisoflavone reductase